MDSEQIIRSTCGHCRSGCGVLIHMAQGKPVMIEGDPESPVNKGALCVKGQASLEYTYNSDRLMHPLKRAGEKGDGKWEQISWDEALSLVATKLTEAKKKCGGESVAFMRGAPKGYQDIFLHRFANVFGSPNFSTKQYVCHTPRRLASEITSGFFPIPDYAYPPACLVIWGSDTSETHHGMGLAHMDVYRKKFWDKKPEYRGSIEPLNKGTKLIVIDPRKIKFCDKTDLWLRLRPGSDLALALGLMNVIINDDLYDKDFIEKWTVGFDKLKTHVQDYNPERVGEITWLEPEKIKEAARCYAINKPACIEWGNAIDHHSDSFQVSRALSILRAITGNLGIPGGEIEWAAPTGGIISSVLELRDKIPLKVKQEKALTAGMGLLPNFVDEDVPPQLIIKSILEKDPYPIRAAYIQGSNPVLSCMNAQEAFRALKELDFIAVADLFMTPTATLADVVLPAASYLEYDSVIVPVKRYGICSVQQKVLEVGECWSDFRIINELAKRVGLSEYFWDDEAQFFDVVLKPLGLTFKEFRKIGFVCGSKEYRKYEVDGFDTPSRKVEIYSSRLEEWGFDPLPGYRELPETPYSEPELAKEYPLVFTSWKPVPYRHSAGRQIATLHGSHPEPVTNIHPETANNLGIKDGDWVYIETKRGRIKQKAALTNDLDPRVVVVDYGWWFPENGSSNSYGWEESNINILTDNNPPYSPEMGTPNLRGIFCKVYKAS